MTHQMTFNHMKHGSLVTGLIILCSDEPRLRSHAQSRLPVTLEAITLTYVLFLARSPQVHHYYSPD